MLRQTGFEDDSWRSHERILSKPERVSLPFGLKDAHKVRDLGELPIYQIFSRLRYVHLECVLKTSFNAMASNMNVSKLKF